MWQISNALTWANVQSTNLSRWLRCKSRHHLFTRFNPSQNNSKLKILASYPYFFNTLFNAKTFFLSLYQTPNSNCPNNPRKEKEKLHQYSIERQISTTSMTSKLSMKEWNCLSQCRRLTTSPVTILASALRNLAADVWKRAARCVSLTVLARDIAYTHFLGVCANRKMIAQISLSAYVHKWTESVTLISARGASHM